jgi:2-polyprenyl-3-methyl-5-hydroxy-6-metoxy-1,4-benzoquinol methylase
MFRCNICGKDSAEAEQARVRSNVRKFCGESFGVWRCPECLSLHAADEVDLAHYYREYPFHHLADAKVNWMLRAMYGRQLARLRAAGLQKDHAILDFGCGDGLFLQYLRDRGYAHAHGYDEYSERFADKSVLGRTYDCVMTQDVLEHVPEPWDFLRDMRARLKPKGVLALGTPNAEAIELGDPEGYVHPLHQPYHRHIFSQRMLVSLGERLDMELLRYYPSMYTNTAIPTVNQRFLTHYFACHDNNVDLSIEPINPKSWKLYTPVTLFYALFGALIPPKTDVMVVYRAR